MAAMKEQTVTMPVEDDEAEEEVFIGAEETVVSATPSFETKRETPTVVLVAVGLGLSVIVFAVLAGVIFFLLTSITGV